MPGKIIDLTNHKFGKLTVKYRVLKPDEYKTYGAYWYCECECGRNCIRSSSYLKSQNDKRILSCNNCGSIAKNLIGKKFGKLTVLYKGEKNQNGDITWKCKCDCGNSNLVTSTTGHLIYGDIKSCGCLHNNKRNKYDLSGEYGIGFSSNNKKEFYFDLEDYNKIKNYCWRMDDRGYVSTNVYDSNGKQFPLLMQNLIMNCEDGYVVDHIYHHEDGSGSEYDNRKSNLRIATDSQNSMNRRIASNNTSGVKGVSWNSVINRWISYITINGEFKYLGCYKEKEKAIIVRKEAEEKYFGEYSYDNSRKLMED